MDTTIPLHITEKIILIMCLQMFQINVHNHISTTQEGG